ncbi:CHAP domain-containing protein, partial [Nakamurella silvestris]
MLARLRYLFLVVTVAIGLAVASAPTADASITWYTKLCVGFSGCNNSGHGNAGYQNEYSQSHWGMFGGHNCTNYTAYRLIKAGVNASYLQGHGMAYEWGTQAAAHGVAVDKNPVVGDIAWWTPATGIGSDGHVAYVESVNIGAGTFVVSEDNYGGDFDWRTYRISEVTGFIHFGGTSGRIADGAFVSYQGNVYRIAGGAPIYVNSWSAVGGPQPTTTLTDAQWSGLRAYPADGTFIADLGDGRVYVTAGGAPLYVAAADAAQVPGWGSRPVIGVDHFAVANFDHLRRYPVDGTFIA